MVENRAEQVEALQTLRDYNTKIVKALGEVTTELKAERKEDTDAYLAQIFKGVNWELQVISGTLEVLNEKENQVSKDDLNNMIKKINDAYTAKDDAKLIAVLENELNPFFSGLNHMVEKAL